MVMYSTPTLDFSTFPDSDGAPMAESIENVFQMTDLQFSFRHYLAQQGLTDWAVGGNQFLYYNRRNENDHCSPDVYVALGVPPGNRRTWQTWVEGKCPDIVMEITSPSTEREDRADKVALYERLGAQEYYIYDPQQATRPIFVAYLRRAGRLTQAPLLQSGGIVSPLLGAELCPVEQYLRLIDPAGGEPWLVPEEVWDAWQAEQEARIAAETRLGQVKTQLVAEELARDTAEAARASAEARAASAEAEIARLRAELARRPDPGQQT